MQALRSSFVALRQSAAITLYSFLGAKPFRWFLPSSKIGDRLYSYLLFLGKHKRRPGTTTFNDKIFQILTTEEIYDPLRVFITDKEFVKLFVGAVLGDKYNVPTLDILRSDDDVDAFRFQQPCVIKPTHSSGRVLHCYTEEDVDRDLLKQWLRHCFYTGTREPNYKTLRKKLIVEPMLFEESQAVDYKVFCVEGVPKMIKVDLDRHSGHLRKFYDAAWNPLPFSWNAKPTDKVVKQPEMLSEMIDAAAALSQHFSFIRVDLYLVEGKVLIGELTNCDGGIGNIFYPKSGEQIATKVCFES